MVEAVKIRHRGEGLRGCNQAVVNLVTCQTMSDNLPLEVAPIEYENVITLSKVGFSGNKACPETCNQGSDVSWDTPYAHHQIIGIGYKFQGEPLYTTVQVQSEIVNTYVRKMAFSIAHKAVSAIGNSIMVQEEQLDSLFVFGIDRDLMGTLE